MRTPITAAVLLAVLGTVQTISAAAQGFDERGARLESTLSAPQERIVRYNTNTYNAQRAATQLPPLPSGFMMHSYIPEPTTTTQPLLRQSRTPRLCTTPATDSGFNQKTPARFEC